MKKIIISLIIALAFSFSAMALHPHLGGGDGTSTNPYQIADHTHLKALTDYVDAGSGSTNGVYYKLMNDIDLSAYSAGEGWMPIGKSGSSSFNFCGNFDGNGKKVKNLTINRPTYDESVGLFGNTNGAAVNNLGVEGCNITGNYAVGGLVGSNRNNSTITNCYVVGNVSGNEYVGGLVGYKDNSTISTSFSAATVNGNMYVGGLVGFNGNSTITNCYATGNVSGGIGGGDALVGGLVGRSWGNTPSITYCYATGNVSGAGNCVGGLVGNNVDVGTIQNCVAANNLVVATNSVSNVTNRVLGWCSNGWMNNVLNNYANNNMVVQLNGVTLNVGSDINGRQGADADLANLQSLAFYTTAGNWADGIWDFTVWNICDGLTLPWLRWEDIDCGDLFVPVTKITGVPTTAMAGTPLTLTAMILPANASFQTISWSVTYAGTTGATITCGNIFNATGEGMAMIKATIANGTAMGTPFTKEFSITVKPVGIETITNDELRITVYPNPTTGQLTIDNGQLTIDNVEVYDIYGKKTSYSLTLLPSYSLLTDEVVINISHLPNGIYFIKIQTDKGLINKKVIKH